MPNVAPLRLKAMSQWIIWEVAGLFEKFEHTRDEARKKALADRMKVGRDQIITELKKLIVGQDDIIKLIGKVIERHETRLKVKKRRL